MDEQERRYRHEQFQAMLDPDHVSDVALRKAQMQEIRDRRQSAFRTELGVWLALTVSILGVLATLWGAR